MSPEMLALLLKSFWETCYMVLASTILATLIGVPLGVILTVTRKNHILPNAPVNSVLGAIVNATRSTPFIILMVAIIPLTRLLVGSSIGTTASIVPLTISAAPFIARIIESSLLEIDHGVIEAAQAMGASPMPDYPQGPFAGSTAFHRFRYHPRCYRFDRLFRHGWYIRRRRLRRSGDPLRLSAFPNGRYADHCRRTYRYGPIYPVTRRLLFQKA